MKGNPTAPAEEGPKKTGRPSKRTDEVIQRILDGLSAGTPLTVICDAEDMPGITTVWEWQKGDEALSEAIARAREAGWDRIAMDALAIADGSDRDTIAFERAGQMVEIPDKEWILRTKLRVETRLKLLAKWDPKRYGDKVTQEITGKDGGPVRTSHQIDPATAQAILERTEQAASVAAGVQPPADFRGEKRDG